MFCVGTRDSHVASYCIDTLLLKNGGKYLRYYATSCFPLQGNPTQCSRGSKKISGAVAGEVRASQYTKYPSHTLISRITLFAICHSFSSPPLHPCRFICPLSLSSLSFSICLFLPSCFLFASVLVFLLVTMAQDNNKLCDFTNTNNNDFISTPIAPHTNDESCNVALLNLVMKDPFSAFLVKMPLRI